MLVAFEDIMRSGFNVFLHGNICESLAVPLPRREKHACVGVTNREEQEAGIGRVQSPRVIQIGVDVALEVAEVLDQPCLSRPLIVTDANLVCLGHVTTVADVLDAAGLRWRLFDGVVEDPTDVCVEAGLAAYRIRDLDCIIGLGEQHSCKMGIAADIRRFRSDDRCQPLQRRHASLLSVNLGVNFA